MTASEFYEEGRPLPRFIIDIEAVQAGIGGLVIASIASLTVWGLATDPGASPISTNTQLEVPCLPSSHSLDTGCTPRGTYRAE